MQDRQAPSEAALGTKQVRAHEALLRWRLGPKQCEPPCLGQTGWGCSKAQAPPETAAPGGLPSLLSDEQSRNRFLSKAGGWAERSGALSALDTAEKSSKGGLCALSAWAFGWERSEEGNRERAMKCLLSPLFLLAREARADFSSCTNCPQRGGAGEVRSELWHCCGHGWHRARGSLQT